MLKMPHGETPTCGNMFEVSIHLKILVSIMCWHDAASLGYNDWVTMVNKKIKHKTKASKGGCGVL